MPTKKLNTIDADTLQTSSYEPLTFLVEELLPQGLHLLAGAPKIGKSWLALWLCLQDLPIFGAPASRCSPGGSRSSTRKEIGS